MSPMRTLFIDATTPRSKERLANSPHDGIPLRVKEFEQRLFVVLAKRSSNAHVTNDGSRYAGRKAIWRIVATRTVLFKDALSFTPRFHETFLDDSVFGRFGRRRSVLLRDKPEGRNQSQGEAARYARFENHHCFPFQAGKRKR